MILGTIVNNPLEVCTGTSSYSMRHCEWANKPFCSSSPKRIQHKAIPTVHVLFDPTSALQLWNELEFQARPKPPSLASFAKATSLATHRVNMVVILFSITDSPSFSQRTLNFFRTFPCSLSNFSSLPPGKTTLNSKNVFLPQQTWRYAILFIIFVSIADISQLCLVSANFEHSADNTYNHPAAHAGGFAGGEQTSTGRGNESSFVASGNDNAYSSSGNENAYGSTLNNEGSSGIDNTFGSEGITRDSNRGSTTDDFASTIDRSFNNVGTGSGTTQHTPTEPATYGVTGNGDPIAPVRYAFLTSFKRWLDWQWR